LFTDVSVPSSRVKNPSRKDSDCWPVKMGPIRCPETSVNNYHTTPRNISEERRSHVHLPSSGMLCSVDGLLDTDVSGQQIGPIFKVQAAWLLKTGPIRCPENFVKDCHSLRNIPEERRSHLQRGGSLKLFIEASLFLIKRHAIVTHGGSAGIALGILNLDIGGSVGSFSYWSLYPMEKNPSCPLYKLLKVPQRRYGPSWEENLPQSGIETRFHGLPAIILVHLLTVLS
jgi:hypothetical protein